VDLKKVIADLCTFPAVCAVKSNRKGHEGDAMDAKKIYTTKTAYSHKSRNTKIFAVVVRLNY